MGLCFNGWMERTGAWGLCKFINLLFFISLIFFFDSGLVWVLRISFI